MMSFQSLTGTPSHLDIKQGITKKIHDVVSILNRHPKPFRRKNLHIKLFGSKAKFQSLTGTPSHLDGMSYIDYDNYQKFQSLTGTTSQLDTAWKNSSEKD